ncbi:ABC transporter ATP-binding protein [Archaeoglobales archaeon]|nr:MAG: ABC transporter ATP-binding protein [Archaeoglobales archaeon]
MLKVEDLSVTINHRNILQDINLKLDDKELTLILGPNGSGKSTLFKAILGLVKADGKIEFNGIDITNLSPYKRFEMGITMAPERMRVSSNLTVEDNILIGAKMDVEEVFAMFPELKRLRKQKAGTLSGGEKQLVVFARAIASKPSLLLLDEPFQGLYEDLAIKIEEKIIELSNELSIAVITHERIEEMIYNADLVVLLLGGKIAYIEKIEDVEKTFDSLRRYMIV